MALSRRPLHTTLGLTNGAWRASNAGDLLHRTYIILVHLLPEYAANHKRLEGR